MNSEAERLKERMPADPFAMACYGRFLQNKVGDAVARQRWQHRAVEAVAEKLSPTVTVMETVTYSHSQHF